MQKHTIAAIVLFLACCAAEAAVADAAGQGPKVSPNAYAAGQMVAMCQMKAKAGGLTSEEILRCDYARDGWEAGCFTTNSCISFDEWLKRRLSAASAK